MTRESVTLGTSHEPGGRASTTKDGHWEDTTTTRDKDGHYTRHHSTGTGSRTETYEKTESDEDPDQSGQETPDPEPPDGDAPVGDGTGGDEGNPDGPLAGLDAVTLRSLLGGDGWKGSEEFDTLGDVDAALGPWMDRIRAALGRPPPLLRTELEAMAVDPLRTSALTVAELHDVATTFAVTAAAVGQSVAVLRGR